MRLSRRAAAVAEGPGPAPVPSDTILMANPLISSLMLHWAQRVRISARTSALMPRAPLNKVRSVAIATSEYYNNKSPLILGT